MPLQPQPRSAPLPRPAEDSRYSLLIYLLLSSLAFFPSLFLGQTYFENDLLTQFVPFRMFLKSQLIHGHFPLWNPYLYGGQPFFANPNSMMCYPLTYLTLLFPIPYDLGVFYFIHMFLAAAGMHFWLQNLGLSRKACRVGALLFAFSGFFWWELIHLSILAAYALFPCLLGFMEKTLKEGKPRWAFLTGLTFALILSCGSFQSTTIIFYTALAYALFRFSGGGRREKEIIVPYRWGFDKWMPILLFLLWGSLPLLIHLIPAAQFAGLSNRKDPSQTYDNFNGTFSMRPSSTYEFLFPTLLVPRGGTIEKAVLDVTDRKNIDNDFLADFGYIGIWAPFLFFLALTRKERRPLLIFLASLGLFFLLSAWGRYFPLHPLLCSILPGVDLSRAPFRFIQTYVLIGCALSAFGFDALQVLFEKNENAQNWLMGAGVYSLLLCFVGMAGLDRTWREMAALVLGMAGLTLWGLTSSFKNLGSWIFQAALVAPLLLSGWNGLSLGPPSNFDYASNFLPFSDLQKKGTGRFYLADNLSYPVRSGKEDTQVPLPENAVVPLGIKNVLGYSPIYLQSQMDIKSLPLPIFGKLMNLRGLVMGPSKNNAIGFTRTEIGGVDLYEPNVPPSALIASTQAVPVQNDAQEILLMALKDYDPNFQIYLRQPLPAALKAKLTPQKVGVDYQLTRDEVDDQLYKVNLSCNALVAFSEIAYPGWKAFLDGQATPIFTANHAFRSVFIPAGAHEVEFHFKPDWAFPLLLMLSVWSVSFLIYLGYLLIPRGKKTFEPPTQP